ncbi:hypothetical protein HOY82DRAFT_29302 [Tuber indicum]|nr:hypothetical protein HOY82DRAFT_29302 [Tuber indicum]
MPGPGKIFKEIADAIKTCTQDRLTFHDVERADFDQVIGGLRLPKNYLEEHAFRIHWFPREKYLKITMPSALYESASTWLYDEISDGLATGNIPHAWGRKISISASPEYSNFKGEYAGYTKEGDMSFLLLVGPDWTEDQCSQPSRADARALAGNSPLRPGHRSGRTATWRPFRLKASHTASVPF